VKDTLPVRRSAPPLVRDLVPAALLLAAAAALALMWPRKALFFRPATIHRVPDPVASFVRLDAAARAALARGTRPACAAHAALPAFESAVFFEEPPAPPVFLATPLRAVPLPVASAAAPAPAALLPPSYAAAPQAELPPVKDETEAAAAARRRAELLDLENIHSCDERNLP